MDERGIIIADRDAAYRSEVANHFRKAGYRVETTDSAVHVLCSILEKQTPVLLLGSDFDQKICSADLIHLLKKCNRNLHVIMVSDDMPLSVARQVRQEGIFYHALKPAAAGDTEELGMAVQCAFEQNRTSGHFNHEKVLQNSRTSEADAEEADAQEADAQEYKSVPGVLQTVPVMACVVALVLGLSYLALVASQRVIEGSSVAMWCFLGFCALIIAAQLLPIFRVKLPVSGSEEDPAKQKSASGHTK